MNLSSTLVEVSLKMRMDKVIIKLLSIFVTEVKMSLKMMERKSLSKRCRILETSRLSDYIFVIIFFKLPAPPVSSRAGR